MATIKEWKDILDKLTDDCINGELTQDEYLAAVIENNKLFPELVEFDNDYHD